MHAWVPRYIYKDSQINGGGKEGRPTDEQTGLDWLAVSFLAAAKRLRNYVGVFFPDPHRWIA